MHLSSVTLWVEEGEKCRIHPEGGGFTPPKDLRLIMGIIDVQDHDLDWLL